jgi:hypothetical protein
MVPETERRDQCRIALKARVCGLSDCRGVFDC